MAWILYDDLIETDFYLNWQNIYMDFPQIDIYDSTDDDIIISEESDEAKSDDSKQSEESSDRDEESSDKDEESSDKDEESSDKDEESEKNKVSDDENNDLGKEIQYNKKRKRSSFLLIKKTKKIRKK